MLTSILTGILGSYIAARWLEYTDRRVLKVRGKLAVLSLKVLLNCIGMTQSRVRQYFKDWKNTPENAGKIYHVWIEETCEKLQFLYEQAVSSIETWSDVIEEANIRTEITKLRELSTSAANLQLQKEQLEKQLAETESKSEHEIQLIKQELDQTKEELKKTKAEVKSERARIDRGVLSGIPSITPSGAGFLSVSPSDFPSVKTLLGVDLGIKRNCSRCGHCCPASKLLNFV